MGVLVPANANKLVYVTIHLPNINFTKSLTFERRHIFFTLWALKTLTLRFHPLISYHLNLAPTSNLLPSSIWGNPIRPKFRQVRRTGILLARE